MLMVERRVFGGPSRALLSRDLMAALRESGPACETCRDIAKEVEPTHEGGEYIEAASFPGQSVRKLDAHFRFHWKAGYEFVVLSGTQEGRQDPP